MAIERILVIRLGAMGDVLLLGPALRGLKARFPEAEIDLLIKSGFAPLLAHHPDLHRLIAWQPGTPFAPVVAEIRQRGYHRVADLQSNLRSRWASWQSGARHRVRFQHHRLKRYALLRWRINFYSDIVPVPLRFLRCLAPWGVEDDGGGLSLFLASKDREAGAAWMKAHGFDGSRPVLAVAPGASRATKRWPLKRFGALAAHFSALGYSILALGGPEDEAACRTVAEAAAPHGASAAGAFTRPETAAALSAASLLLTNDTGLMHMACALDVPVAALFGPTTHHFGFFPFRARSGVIESDEACRPCSKHGTEACPKGHFNCMKSIAVETVTAAVTQLLLEEKKE